jgi:hypothetical protein
MGCGVEVWLVGCGDENAQSAENATTVLKGL